VATGDHPCDGHPYDRSERSRATIQGRRGSNGLSNGSSEPCGATLQGQR